MAHWAPARSGAHPASQSVAAGGHFEFAKPAQAEGFILGTDGTIMVTFDGTVATATNGFLVDGTKWTVGLVPIDVTTQVSVYNKGASACNVQVAWVENLSG